MKHLLERLGAWRRPLLRFNLLTMPLLAGILAGERLGAAPMWPQFRGPNCQGVDESGQPPVEFGPNTNFLWKLTAPPGLSSPCIWGDYIFLTAHENGKLSTLCIARREGRMLWRQPAPTEKVEEVHKASNPAIADSKMYVRTSGHLWAFGR